MTTGRGRPPSSPADPSFPRLTFAHPHFNSSRRSSPFSPHSSTPPLSLSLSLQPVRTIYTYTCTERGRRTGREGRGGRRSIGTLLAAFPDPPHRRYQDCRRTDQCRERRRRLGVHRRLLGRTAGHGRTLENRPTALRDLDCFPKNHCARTVIREPLPLPHRAAL